MASKPASMKQSATKPAAPAARLTPRQRRILDFIHSTVRERGYPPTVREIGQAVGLTSSSSVHAQLEKAHANPGANGNQAAWMQGHLGQIGLLQRLQDGLQSRPPLLKAFDQGHRTTIKQLVHRGLSRRTEFCRVARTPGECGRTAASRRKHLGIKIAPSGYMGYRISRRPAWTIGRAAPVALRPAPKRLRQASRLVRHNGDVCKLFTGIEGHTNAPSRYTNTASSTSKTVGCCTGVHKA